MDHPQTGLTGITRHAAFTAGALGLVALVIVLGGEATQGTDFMGSGLAEVTGWIAFTSACLLVLGIAGLAARYGDHLTATGRAALSVLTVATAATVGATATLALVVPALVERAPDIADNPPASVPAVFILSGLAMGAGGLVLARDLRGAVSRGTMTLLVVASVVAMVPLPSRFFLLAFAVAVLLGSPASVTRTADEVVSQPV